LISQSGVVVGVSTYTSANFVHPQPHFPVNHFKFSHNPPSMFPRLYAELYAVTILGSRDISNLCSGHDVACTTLSQYLEPCTKCTLVRPNLCKPSMSLMIETRPGSSDRSRTFLLRGRSLFPLLFFPSLLPAKCNMRG